MSDARLWRRLKNGEVDALKEIYEKHIDFLLAYGKRFGGDPNLVRDALHDLFVYIWKNHQSIGETDAIRPYLATALRRRILKTTKRDRDTVNTGPESDYTFKVEAAVDADLVKEETAAENSAKLNAALEKLSNREKEVLLLKYQQDMDYKDIAELMDINYQSVRNLATRAMKKLRNFLEIWIGWMVFTGF